MTALLGSIFAAVFIVFAALGWAQLGDQRARRRLLELTRSGEAWLEPAAVAEAPGPGDEQAGGGLAGALRQLAEASERYLAGRSLADRWRRSFRRAGVRLRVSEFLALSALVAVAATALGFVVLGAFGASVAGVAGLALPGMLLRAKAEERRRALDSQLPDALALLSGALRAGYSLLQALDVIAREMPDPIGQEFAAVVRETRLNIDVEDALHSLMDRTGSDDVEIVVTVISVQRQVGGNLADILERIQHTIRERIRIQGEIRTLTAQGRASGWIIGALPIVLALLLGLINPDYILTLVREPAGRAMIGIAVGMELIGVWLIRRIVRFAY